MGTYEYKGNDTYRLVFQKNGIMKGYDYRGGDEEHTWSIVGNEIHTDYRLLENGKRMTGTILSVTAYRIDQDHMDILVNSITKITTIEDGKREDLSKFHQFTDKNIRQLTSEENIIVGTYEQKQMILV